MVSLRGRRTPNSEMKLPNQRANQEQGTRTVLEEIRAELQRIGANSVRVSLDAKFEPKAGELVKVELASAYWHLQPGEFLRLLNELPDGVGSEKVKIAIEKKAAKVWHGPAPLGSRDS